VADAFSRVTGGKKVGVCTVMGGLNAAGIQMAYGAIAQAFEDSSPLLVLTDGVPVGSSVHTHYDISLGFKAITKWIGEIDKAQRVPDFLRRAFTLLRSGRPGPVLLTIPRNLGEYDEEEFPYAPVKSLKWAPDPDDVKAAVKALLASKNPMLYVGEGVFYGDATQELLQFAELAQIPVATTLKGKSAFPENHSLSLGIRGEPVELFMEKADLVFALGSSLFPNRFSHAIPNAKHKTLVQCTVDTLDINRSYRTDVAVIGDAKLTLKALIDELSLQAGGGRKPSANLLEEIRTVKERHWAKYRPALESDEKPINPYRVYGDLMKVLDPYNSFVSPDSGNTRDQTSTVWESRIPRGFLGWGNVSTLGFGMAAAVGAKLAYPERQCVNITGDAGAAYMAGNLEPLVRNRIGVTIVQINNGGFTAYGPGPWGPGHDPYTWKVSDHSTVDMSAMAQAVGFYAEDVSEPSEIIPALNRAFAENSNGRPAYLEFLCGRYPVYGSWIV
jgi:acetolactate synthase-1/2/3 large subunit